MPGVASGRKPASPTRTKRISSPSRGGSRYRHSRPFQAPLRPSRSRITLKAFSPEQHGARICDRSNAARPSASGFVGLDIGDANSAFFVDSNIGSANLAFLIRLDVRLRFGPRFLLLSHAAPPMSAERITTRSSLTNAADIPSPAADTPDGPAGAPRRSAAGSPC